MHAARNAMTIQGRDGVLERNASVTNELAPPGATPTLDTLPRRLADFATLGEALDYAAKGKRGLNFHDARGTLTLRLSLSAAARGCARRGAPLRRARHQARRPHRAGRRNRARIRGLLLRRGLCRRLAGAAAAADQLRRPRSLCRPARRAAQKLRSGAVPLPAGARRFRPGRGRQRRRHVARLGYRSTSVEPAAGELPTADGRRHRLSAIFERLDPLPARRRGHPPRAARQSPRARRRARGDADRPRHFLAALVSRHGPGRLPAVAGRDADVGRLSEDRGFRPPAARLARPDHPQSRARRSATRRPSATTSARAG